MFMDTSICIYIKNIVTVKQPADNLIEINGEIKIFKNLINCSILLKFFTVQRFKQICFFPV